MPRRPRPAHVLVAVNALLLVLLLPLGAQMLFQPIQFNQFDLHRIELRHGVLSSGDAVRALRSAYSSGLKILTRQGERSVPDFEDGHAIASYVFSWAPRHAMVYPTEGFYYYRFQAGTRHLAGNLRVADLDHGELTVAYFDRQTMETRTFYLDEEDGLEVQRHSPWRYDVTFGGHTVMFHISQVGSQAPEKLKMLPEEEFVAQIHDESGLRFFLMFNHATDSFYDVLNDESGIAEELRPVPDSGFVIGGRTGFLFYDDPEFDRRILVGLPLENVVRNTFLDGPPDQVPFRANVRDLIYKAYPATQLGKGLDEHGVMLGGEEWARVAVAPVNVYVSVAETAGALQRMADGISDRSELWTRLTKEYWNTAEWIASVDSMLAEEGKEMIPPKWVSLMRDRAGESESSLP